MSKTIDTAQLTQRYFEPASITMSEPRFVLIVGGIGAGKTTLRQQRFNEGYVVIDGGEIFRDIVEDDVDDTQVYMPTIDLVGRTVAERAIRERRNIVMEIVGDDQEMVLAIQGAVAGIGYITSLAGVTCDIDEAIRRSAAAVEADCGYLSSYFTQEMHRDWIVDAVAAE